MSSPPRTDAHHELPWPDHYADLQSAISEQWGVTGDIYLVRQLSGGKSGAFVYVADLNSRDFGGQAILKFDDYPDPESKQVNEAERHRKAFESNPEYAAAHLPKIVNAYVKDRRLVILSTIAGRGLEYAEPWWRCPYDVQISTASTLSREILEDWNRDYQLTDGLRTPEELLHGWLGYRLDPNSGRIHDFMKSEHNLAPEQPTFMLDGDWFPNPLTFVSALTPLPEHLHLRAITGNLHGDLHGNNILVLRQPDQASSYYLIDLALFEADQYLFYDHAYFELTHLLRSRDKAGANSWLSILESVGRLGQGGAVRQGDDLGLVQLIAAIRREAFAWVERHEGNRLSYMESQALTARVAAGLCFTHRKISSESRSIAFIYAAQNLKHLLQHHGADWPKYGPPMTIGEDGIETASTVPSAQAVKAEPPQPPQSQIAETTDESSAGEEYPAVPDGKQAIAVIAFENLSGDPDQDYFASGVTEDLVTELARIDWLTVIAQESALARKGTAVDARQIGKELGVHYVVTGSVRKSRDAVRVNAHLIDTETRLEIWSERFDRKIADVFAVQDEITAAIVGSIDSEAKTDQREHAARKRGPLSLWDIYQKAMWHYFRMTPDDDQRALEEAHQAIRTAPGFAAAYAVLSLLETRRVLLGLSSDPAKDLESAAGNGKRAVALDQVSAVAHMAFAQALTLQGDHDTAIAEAELGIQLNPSSANAHLVLGGALVFAGQPVEALAAVERGIRFSPKDPMLFALKGLQAMCNADLGNLRAAEADARQAENAGPHSLMPRLALAVILVRGDRSEEARAVIAEALRLRPALSFARVEGIVQAMEPARRDRFLADLRAAGLTD